MRVTLPTGTFALLTPWEAIHGAWVDERAVDIKFSDGSIDHSAQAVFRLSSSPTTDLKVKNTPLELRGHTLEPNGFQLRALRQENGAARIEVARRS